MRLQSIFGFGLAVFVGLSAMASGVRVGNSCSSCLRTFRFELCERHPSPAPTFFEVRGHSVPKNFALLPSTRNFS